VGGSDKFQNTQSTDISQLNFAKLPRDLLIAFLFYSFHHGWEILIACIGLTQKFPENLWESNNANEKSTSKFHYNVHWIFN